MSFVSELRFKLTIYVTATRGTHTGRVYQELIVQRLNKTLKFAKTKDGTGEALRYSYEHMIPSTIPWKI